MRILYLDIFSGISGDMFLGALLDLGVSERALKRQLGKLHLHGYSISKHRRTTKGISGIHFRVRVNASRSISHRHGSHGHHHHPPHAHRAYADIKRLINSSGLDVEIKKRSLSMFTRIAEAEGKIHAIPASKVHFHEVGAIDSIVDIVGAAIAVRELGADKVIAREVEEGTGFIDISHGRYPVPAPAILEILRGVPVRQCDEPNEIVTPTGATILKEYVESFGPMPQMTIERVGYGIGTRQLKTRPNVLRAVLGHSGPQALGHSGTMISVIETNIDDMNPQLFGGLMDLLFDAGALDVFHTAVQMKKNRPGVLLTVLCEPEQVDELSELILQHTTTFGMRIIQAQRRMLDREMRKVKTRYGVIEVKIGRWKGKIISTAPEYESCKKAAARHKVPVKLVYAEVQRAKRT